MRHTLLVGRDPFFFLDLSLDVLDGVLCLDFQRNGFARQSLHEDLHPAAEAEDQIQRRFLLDVVVLEGPAVLKLLPREDQPLGCRAQSLFRLEEGIGCEVAEALRK